MLLGSKVYVKKKDPYLYQNCKILSGNSNYSNEVSRVQSEFIQWCNTDTSMWDSETSTWAVVTTGIRPSGISCHEAVKSSMPPNCEHTLLTIESRIDFVADQKSGRTLPYEALAVSSKGKPRTETLEECKRNAWPTFWSWDKLGWSAKNW